MKTISISLDDQTKQTLDRMAKDSRRTRSDIVRDMVAWYELSRITDEMQRKAKPLLRRLQLETDQQIADYASAD